VLRSLRNSESSTAAFDHDGRGEFRVIVTRTTRSLSMKRQMNEHAERGSPQLLAMVARISWCAVALAVLAPAPARATSSYPPKIRTTWGVTEPACTLCHKTLDGGASTVTKPFGRDAVTLYGLTGGSDLKLLATVLGSMQGDGVDSDADGRSNYDELLSGTDPNDKKSFLPAMEVPSGGAGGAPATDPIGAGGEGELSACRPSRVIFPTPEYGCSLRRSHPEQRASVLVAWCVVALGLVSLVRRIQIRRSDRR
jgi:hypothetical protein